MCIRDSLGQPSSDQSIHARVIPTVQAGVGKGHKASTAFVAASCTGIKMIKPLLNRPLNRGVVTDLEMEAIDFFITAPVPAPQVMGIAYAHRHRYGITRITAMG